ncbi:MAG: tetratricopeptide repeat protein [Elusimicrobiota bacterium]
MGLKNKALFYSKKALKESPGSEEAILEAAMALRLAGKRKRAQALFYSLIRLYSSSKDFAGLSYVWWAMGGLKRNYGELAAAVSCFEKSFSFAVKARDRSLKVYALFGLAGALRIKGEIEKSAAVYRKAASYAPADDIFAKAYSFCGLANALRQKGGVKKALALYRRSGKLYSAMGDKPDLGFVSWGMGEILKKQGNFKAAISNFRKAYHLFKAGMEKRGEILSLFSMAQSLYALGRIKEADKMYFSALKEARKENFKTYLEIFT